MSFTVIIPSKTAGNLARCIAAVRRHEPHIRIVVIDDGIDWKEFSISSPSNIPGLTFQHASASEAFNVAPHSLVIIQGVNPFVFARNCNLGIRHCAGDDIVLLNDDAVLETPYGFHDMQEVSQERPEFGLISAVTNIVGNSAQRPQDGGLREEPRTVAFVCVYIPRRTIDQVGLLDERFTAYGWEDNDYCRRVREAGLKIGIFDDCYVDHGSLRSTFRGLATAAGDITAGREIYKAKWGDAR